MSSKPTIQKPIKISDPDDKSPDKSTAQPPKPNAKPDSTQSQLVPMRRRSVEDALGIHGFGQFDAGAADLSGIMEDSFDQDSRSFEITRVFNMLLAGIADADIMQSEGNRDKIISVFSGQFIGGKFNKLSTKEQFRTAMRYAMMIDDDNVHDILASLGIKKLDLFPRTQPALLIALILLEVKRKTGTQPIYRLLKKVSEGLSQDEYRLLIKCAEDIDEELNSELPGCDFNLKKLIAAKLLNYALSDDGENLHFPDISDSGNKESESSDEEDVWSSLTDHSMSTGPNIIHPSRIFPDAEDICELLEVLYTDYPEIYDWVLSDIVRRLKSRPEGKKNWLINMAVGFPLKGTIDRFFSEYLGIDIAEMKRDVGSYLQPAIDRHFPRLQAGSRRISESSVAEFNGGESIEGEREGEENDDTEITALDPEEGQLDSVFDLNVADDEDGDAADDENDEDEDIDDREI